MPEDKNKSFTKDSIDKKSLQYFMGMYSFLSLFLEPMLFRSQ